MSQIIVPPVTQLCRSKWLLFFLSGSVSSQNSWRWKVEGRWDVTAVALVNFCCLFAGHKLKTEFIWIFFLLEPFCCPVTLGSTHTNGNAASGWPQNSSHVADGKYISLVLYRVAVSNSHKRQNAVCISICRRLTPVSSTKKKTLSSSRCQHRAKTQRCSCEIATLQ